MSEKIEVFEFTNSDGDKVISYAKEAIALCILADIEAMIDSDVLKYSVCKKKLTAEELMVYKSISIKRP